MASELHSNTPSSTAEDKREYVYVRYENTDDDEMDIYDIIDLCQKGLQILKRYFVLLLVFVIVGGLIGFGKAKLFPQSDYTSSALLFVDLDRGEISSGNNMDESSRISMLANSFSEIVRSESVVAPISKQYASEDETFSAFGDDAVAAKMQDLRENITVEVPAGSQTIKVSVTDSNAQRAQTICDSIVSSGISAMSTVTNYASISVVSPASEAFKTSTESTAQSIATMAAVFLILALLIVVIRELGAAYKAHKADESKK